jgi:putative ABC transport system ATP-binding protein
MAAPAIDIRGLEFRYRPALPPVLKIPELHLESGESCFLYGPSGCGKTTLLGLIAGVLTTRTGNIEVLGENLSNLSGAKRDRFRGSQLGYIFQMFNLIPYLSVRENILLACRLHKQRRQRLGSETLEAASTRIAGALGIEGLLERGVTELSVGQQQRVAAARALLGAPPLIIADEPTSALDTAHREQFLKLLLDQAKLANSTVLFVSHDQSLAPLFDRRISLPEVNQAAC